MAGIYIHIPFCRQACHYCDFHFSTQLGAMEEMVNAICTELELRKTYLGSSKIETIYFGGGTPSLLQASFLDKILSKIYQQFSLDLQEVTLEANPDDLQPENLQQWKLLGIDRLSLGIQSFQEEILNFYNRAHSAEDAKQAITKAREAGFSKFSIDMIYGFPAADHTLWQADLEEALSQDPGHISAYALTVEPKTALGNWTKKGKFLPADEDFVANQFEYLQSELEKNNYIQYEVSNFGKEGQFALHNSNYWKGISYLGIGPSAHSFDGKTRGMNPSSNPRYLKQISQGIIPTESETLSLTDALNERILTGLRTIWGVSLEELRMNFGIDLLDSKKSEIADFKKQGWLKSDDKTLSLTKSGLLLADSIAAKLFL